MKKLLLSSLLSSSLLFANAQNLPPASVYKFSSIIDSIFKQDSSPYKYDIAASDYLLIGEYQTSLKLFELINNKDRKIPNKEQTEMILKEFRKTLSGYKSISAKQYILQEAKKTSILIVNESHHKPLHRLFMESLLPELYLQGYTMIGMEALYNTETFRDKKYPLLNNGIYIKEPCFGNMIRAALDQGYTLFGYETKRNVNGKDREIDQAENIKKVIDQNPNKKMIIYCGYAHAQEDSTHNQWEFAMAERVKRLTGVNPLTIDQTELMEYATPEFDNFFRQTISLDYPAVFIDEKGNAFNRANPIGIYDAHVYHPDTKYINGRPDWLLTNNKKTVAIHDRITIGFPCLVFAYKDGEDIEQAIPVDVIELKDKNDTKKLILYKNTRYKILIKNIAGEKQMVQL